jgi:hypothetical protein
MGDVPEQVYLDAARAALGVPDDFDSPTLRVRAAHDWHRRTVLTAYRAGQAATPGGPRRWQLPAEPGPEVTALQDRLGRTWSRVRGLPLWGGPETGSVLPFVDLLDHYGPLTDATPAADGQDGRDG